MKVTYIDHMGDNNTPTRQARCSYNGDNKEYTEEQNDKLLTRLIKDKHFGVLEGCITTVMVECSIPIARQIMRHRTASYGELSRRYLDDKHTPFEFEIPKPRGDKDTKILIDTTKYYITMKEHYNNSIELYEKLRKQGIAKEIARYVIPQGMKTRFYMTMNLRNWLHFLELRLDKHAQLEVREVAKEIKDILSSLYPSIFNKIKLGN